MSADVEQTVVVRRHWNDWRKATYPLSALTGVHWSDTSGGTGGRANQRYVHGYVDCDGMLEGELAHSCLHGEGPHRIKVCVVARDNSPRVMALLRAEALR